MIDLIIRGGAVVDGAGHDRVPADVGIDRGHIVAVGEVDESARAVIDATDLVVAPGFIDVHTHYDAQVLWDPLVTPSPLHGVTTVIGGNCGFTIAPVDGATTDYMTRLLARVEGIPLESLLNALDYGWHTFGEYLDRLDGRLAVNAGFLVGHSAIRRLVMGERSVEDEASDDEIAAMCRVLADSITAGGLGFSSSQAPSHHDGAGDPVPSRAAAAAEIVALARTAGRHPGTTLEIVPAVGAFEERHLALMADMSAAANRPLNWNVLVPTADRADHVRDMLAASDYAAERGGRVYALTVPDVPRTHVSLRSGTGFDALPGWRRTMALPVDEKMRALRDAEEVSRLRDGARSEGARLFPRIAQFENLLIVETFTPENQGLAGRTIGEVAAARGQEPFDCLLEASLRDDLRTVLQPPLLGDDDASWELRRDVWRDPRALVGASDAGAHLDMLSTFSFTTAMLQACRERGLMAMEEAVALVTDRLARVYGLTGRGRIAPGWHADLVVFDPERVAPGPVVWRNDLPAGAGRLHADAVGVHHVVVGGTEILRDGCDTGARPGTVLRSGRDTETVTASG